MVLSLDWKHFFNLNLAIESFPFVIQGIGYTFLISFVSMGAGLFIGFFLCLARRSSTKFLRLPARLYISFMRGIPMLALLFILYFGLPVFGIQLTAISSAIIGFSMNCAAYIAEVQRASLNSVSKGQWDAGYAIGLSNWQTLYGIIIPQAARIAIPSLLNIFLDLVKASSLAAVISVPELLFNAQIVAGRTYDSITLYLLVALIYWVICIVISTLTEIVEKRFSQYQ
ncbi:ABC transporter permease subunit [Neobacillus sp. OS1-33]|uniref:amino acid ABC transporter permease n=1 Tax=Neobacillus sp. OS1-33 TaxID=3070683 RepID=UPI0027DFB952|nr:ABC transporter permease subunit [Neobacillus sp. OS1-33]WML24623.1 ABC transporter permease subunit [Neobacillus sp. OS1-33]